MIFHFLDVNPIHKYVCMMEEPAIPFIPNYIINETSSFIIDFASIWVMFIVADIMLKEKDLRMKEILSVKPVGKLSIFLGKFSACFFTISVMVGLVFIIAWIGEIRVESSPALDIYMKNYILDVLPVLFFSESTVVLFSMIFGNTKITYVVYFLFRFFNSSVFFHIFPLKFFMLFTTYYFNSRHLSVSLDHHIFLKGELLFISLVLAVIAYILYTTYFLKEKGGLS